MTPRQGHQLLGIRMVSPGRLRKAIPPNTRSTRVEGPPRDEFTGRTWLALGVHMWPRHGDPTSISLATGANSLEGPGEGGQVFRLSRGRVAVQHDEGKHLTT